MPYLGDYLGHLLSEIATARVQADLETVRMAELYASHPLLKHLPVPRFRLPNLTLDVPVLIQDVEQARPAESNTKLGGPSTSLGREEAFPERSPTPASSRLLVQVTNTALRDAGPAELLTKLHLSISEDAVEWTTVESQGQTIERLLPE